MSARYFGEREKKGEKYSLAIYHKPVEELNIPGVDDAKRAGRGLDWVPAEVERPALARIGEAEVEKRALVRFALFTALRERRVAPREVSIV